jgi:hypothetical protein
MVRRFNDRAKSIMVINSRKLIKAFGDETSFVTVNTTIRLLFKLLDPFVADNIVLGRSGTKGPSVVGEQGLEFSSHGSNPFGLRCSLTVCGRRTEV